ncbi:MAG: hypothetical protein GKS06_07900 [Acidobacteria bacterium]|nr:hypothetical protein [Acidobacteriota bacterium]
MKDIRQEEAAGSQPSAGSAMWGPWSQNRLATALGGAALATLAVSLPCVAQERPTFGTTSELVVIHVMVLTDNMPATDLTVEDFRVIEDGEVRPISVFVPPVWEPGELVVAVDASGSMNLWPMREMAGELLDSLHPGSCVLLMPFRGEGVLGGIWGHPGDPFLRESLATLPLLSNEAIFDAIIAASDQLQERRLARGLPPSATASEQVRDAERALDWFGHQRRGKANQPVPTMGRCELDALEERLATGIPERIVLVTDGDDHRSYSSLEDAMLSAWGVAVPYFILAAEPGSSSGARLYATLRAFDRLTEFTGGAVFRGRPGAPDHPQVRKALARLTGALRAHYVIGYVPAGTTGADPLIEREVEVTVARPDHEVLAPSRGYGGSARTTSMAVETARRGFRQLAAQENEAALSTFERATASARDLGPAHYGRGLALQRLGRLEDAAGDLARAADLDPWLPGLRQRLANLLLDLRDPEAAWEHALAAREAGADVEELVNRLQEVSPRTLEPLPQTALPRVWLSARGADDLLAQTTAFPALLTATYDAIWRSSTFAVATSPDAYELSVELDLDRVRRRGAAIEARGKLVLRDADNRKLAEARFELRDVMDERQRATVLRVAVEELEAAIRTP